MFDEKDFFSGFSSFFAREMLLEVVLLDVGN